MKRIIKNFLFMFFVVFNIQLLALTPKDAENPKVAFQEVLNVFKEQIKKPITKMIVKIPYNINYSMTIDNKNYYVSEYKIRIIFKTLGMGNLFTGEKSYIIRFLVDSDKNIVTKEEVYSLIEEKSFKQKLKK